MEHPDFSVLNQSPDGLPANETQARLAEANVPLTEATLERLPAETVAEYRRLMDQGGATVHAAGVEQPRF